MTTATKSKRSISARQCKRAVERENLILSHLPLVKYVLTRVAANLPHHVDREDLYEAGITGLMDAADRFDPSRNVQFRTYAVPRVRGAIIDALRNEDWLPRSMRGELSRLGNARAALEQEHSRPPTQDELAGRLGIQKKKLDRLSSVSANSTFHSLDDIGLTAQDSDSDLLQSKRDTAEHPAAKAVLEEEKTRLAEAIARLPQNERLVVSLYYFEHLQLQQIAEILRVTSSRVCQIHHSALNRLQRLMDESERPRVSSKS